MKLPRLGWKLKAFFLTGVFLTGACVGQLPFRDILPKEDADLMTSYWLLNKAKMPEVAASIRQSNALKFEANNWKHLEGGVQIASAGKP